VRPRLDVVQIKGLLRKRKLNLTIGSRRYCLLSVHPSMLMPNGTGGKSIAPSCGVSDLNGFTTGWSQVALTGSHRCQKRSNNSWLRNAFDGQPPTASA
jgi:hypothetical protein